MAFRMSRDHADFVAHGGTEWDDGAFVNVKKIKIFHDWAGITLVQFDYIDGTGAIVSGLDHGRVPVEGARAEFWLRDDEYITIVTAFGGYCVRKIEFITNKRTFDFGVEAADPEYFARREAREALTYELPATYGDMGRPIVGFHGKSGIHYLHELGVYFR